MSNSPFFNSALDVSLLKCSNNTQECLESGISVLSDISSYTSNNQFSEDQLLLENFRDLNVSSVFCNPSKLEDVGKNIAPDSFDDLEVQNAWKHSQEKCENLSNQSKNFVPGSAYFLKEMQGTVCDKNYPSKEDQTNSQGVKLAKSLPAKKTIVKDEDNGLELTCTNIEKLKTGEGIYFCCSICHSSFKSQSNAVLHLQEHGISKPYKCDWCGNLSRTELEAKAHQQLHGCISRKKCRQPVLEGKMERHKTECGLMLTNPTLQSTSLSAASAENSSLSEDSDNDNAGMELAPNQERIKGLYACEECNKCFPAYEELMAHRETQHFGAKGGFVLDTFCSPPRTTDSSDDNVSNNVLNLNESDPPKEMKTGEKNPIRVPRNFVCSTCGKAFKASKPLREHEVVHTGARDFACEICGKAFGTRANMKIHLATHSDQRPFLCTMCNAAFRQKDSLKVHFRKHSGERPFPCTVCNMRFDRNFTLKNHLLTHGEEKSYVCVVCGKAFATRGGLNNHERLHSKDPTIKKVRKPPSKPGTGNWICDECGKLYSTRSNLKMHQRSHEPIAVTHPCFVCGRVYKHKDSLEVHMRTHTESRPFTCTTCGKHFFRNWTLKLHMITHTGERPHKCLVEHCGKAFTQSSSLYNHVQNYHKHTDSANQKSVEENVQCSEEALAVNPLNNQNKSIVTSAQTVGHLVPPMFVDASPLPCAVSIVDTSPLPCAVSIVDASPLPCAVSIVDASPLPCAVSNLLIPSSLENPLSASLTDDLPVKVGVGEIHSSVLNGLNLTSEVQDAHMNDVVPLAASAMCRTDVSLNLVWENTVLPMDITNMHLPQPEQPPLQPLPQPMDPVYMMQDNIPLLVNMDGQLYQQDDVKMAGSANFVSQ